MRESRYSHVLCAFIISLFLCASPFYSGKSIAAVGAISGSFSVNSSGAARYTVPIEVPPGIGGMTPKLALNYSSRARNGFLGVGWSVDGLSSVSRCRSTFAQDGVSRGVKLDRSDRLCLGKSRLVNVSGGYGTGGTEYRTEKDTSSKIVQNGGDCGGPCGFTVYTKDRRIIEYGGTPNSRDTASSRNIIYRWSVSKISDRSGNSIFIQYEKGGATENPRVSTISYAGTNTLSPAIEIKFIYESRPDPQPSYLFGDLRVLNRRLAKVAISLTANGSPLTEYQLSYGVSATNGASVLKALTRCGFDSTGVSDCMRPTVFDWTDNAPQYLDWVESPVGSIPILPGAAAGTADDSIECQVLTQGDVNGDGLTDLICVFSTVYNGKTISNTDVQLSEGGRYRGWVVYRDGSGASISANACKPLTGGDVNGDGLTDMVCLHADGQTYVQLSEANQYTDWMVWNPNPPPGGISGCLMTRLADVNGDKRIDLVCLRASATYVELATDGGFTNWQQWSASQFPNNISRCRLLSTSDVDGDSLADIVCALDTDTSGNSGQITYVQRSLGTRYGNWESWYVSPGKSSFKLDNCNALLQSDVNGDNLQDMICARANEINVSLSTGAAYLGWRNLGGDIYDTRACARLMSADVDGDGRADLICPIKQGGSTTTYIKRSSGTDYSGWEAMSVKQSIDLSNCATVLPVDANGDGLIDLACPYRLPDFKNTTYLQNLIKLERYVGIPERSLPKNRELSQPDMIERLSDGYNNNVSIGYAPLTDPAVYTVNSECSWTPGTAAAYPNRCIKVPIYAVSSITSTDGIGGLSTASYHYEDAGLNSEGRGFLGFQKVISTDEQTGIVSTTQYDQRFVNSPDLAGVFVTIGFPVSVEKKQANGTLIKTTTNEWRPTELRYNGVYRVDLWSNRVATYELDGSLIRLVDTRNGLQDEYGNAGEITESVMNLDLSAMSRFTKVTRSTFSNDPYQWFIGLPTRTEVTLRGDERDVIVQTSEFEYDSVTGDLSAKIDEPEDPELKLRTAYTYDSYGNLSSRTFTDSGQANYPITMRRERESYDYSRLAVDSTFTQSSANAVGHYTEALMDLRFGLPKQVTDPNALVTLWQYDVFGRPITQQNPDGTQVLWKREWCDASCPAYAVRRTTLWKTGEPTTITYYDALGREVRTETTGFDGRTIAKDTQYDRFGRVARQSRNYFFGDTIYWSDFTYDLLNRPIAIHRPDGGNIQMSYTKSTKTTRLFDDIGSYDQTTTSKYNSRGEEIAVIDSNNQALYKHYDAAGSLLRTIDAEGNVTRIEYDILGRKTVTIDSDMGRWEYSYDALGQLRQQKDSKNQSVIYNYDRLGRVIVRDEPEGRTTWSYDAGYMAKGSLVEVNTPHFRKNLTYDYAGRLTDDKRTSYGNTLSMTRSYDYAGRLARLGYPNGFSVNYRYNFYGYLSQVENGADSAEVFWRADDSDADGNVTLFSVGNRQQTVRLYEPFSGRLQQISTGVDSSSDTQFLTYKYNALGNLLERKDVNANLTETFEYDSVNRFIVANVVGMGAKNYRYDVKGNITEKNGVGDYRYGENGAGAHAVTFAGGKRYSYDANGNMTTAGGRNQTWTSFNKVKGITENLPNGMAVASFQYDEARARIFHSDIYEGKISSTQYFDNYYEEFKDGSGTVFRYFVYVDGEAVLQYERNVKKDSTTNIYEKYLHYDNLGSVYAVTYRYKDSPFFFVLAQMSFDAFGARRLADTWGAASPSQLPRTWPTPRGYTGHEQLDNFGLVHMNGRIYDPKLGRFLSADPFVQDVGDLQSLNRYSYVRNNPLSYTDPTGYFYHSSGGFLDGVEINGDFSFNLDDLRFGYEDFSNPLNGADLFTFNEDNFSDSVLSDNDFVYREPVETRAFSVADPSNVASDSSFFTRMLDRVQLTLDVIGAADIAVPILAPFSILADSASGLISLFRGDSFGAAASFSAALPFAFGAAGTVAKLGDRAMDVGARVTKGAPNKGIYEFTDKVTGKPYVGQSGNISKRLQQHEKAGKLEPGCTVCRTEVSGGKTAREIAEHRRIQELTGGVPARRSPDVSNKVDPIGPKRQHLLE